jgi:hypothetical protein
LVAQISTADSEISTIIDFRRMLGFNEVVSEITVDQSTSRGMFTSIDAALLYANALHRPSILVLSDYTANTNLTFEKLNTTVIFKNDLTLDGMSLTLQNGVTVEVQGNIIGLNSAAISVNQNSKLDIWGTLTGIVPSIPLPDSVVKTGRREILTFSALDGTSELVYPNYSPAWIIHPTMHAVQLEQATSTYKFYLPLQLPVGVKLESITMRLTNTVSFSLVTRDSAGSLSTIASAASATGPTVTFSPIGINNPTYIQEETEYLLIATAPSVGAQIMNARVAIIR